MDTGEDVVAQIHSFYVVQYRISNGLEEIGQHPLLGNKSKTDVYPHELKELNERNKKHAKEKMHNKGKSVEKAKKKKPKMPAPAIVAGGGAGAAVEVGVEAAVEVPPRADRDEDAKADTVEDMLKAKRYQYGREKKLAASKAKNELEKKKMLKNGGLVKKCLDVFLALLPLGVLLLGLLAIYWFSSF